jgi:hypothetical protein
MNLGTAFGAVHRAFDDFPRTAYTQSADPFWAALEPAAFTTLLSGS